MMRREMTALMVAMALLMGCAGCGGSAVSGETATFTGPYAADFQNVYESTEHALIRDIVKDFAITDAEFEEFKKQYEDCMSSHGLTWSYDVESGDQIAGNADNPNPEKSAIDAASEQCQTQTGYMDIMPLYQSVNKNPDKLSDDALTQLTIDCLVRHEYLEPGTTVPEYRNLLQDHDAYTERFGQYLDWEQNPEDYRYFYDCEADPVHAE